jgi:putative glycosyltransferase
MRVSVVTTLYHSAAYLREFHRRLLPCLAEIADDYEILFVNDGSPDDSLAVALELQRADPHVVVIDLSRNFGHHPAMMTGLRHARGEWIFLIDSDLEEEPELLRRFDQVRRSGDIDVVYGVQDVRRGSLARRFSGWLYYKFLNSLSRDPLPENLLTVRLMSRRYVDALLLHQEVELNIAGLWVRTGFRQVPIAVEKRDKGRSTYNLARKFAMLANGITSFTSQPLVFIFYFGCFILALSTAAAGTLIVRQLFFQEMLAGYPSTIVSIWLLGGLILFCQGVIGIYLSKVVLECKRRPLAVIREIYTSPAAAPADSAAAAAAPKG